MSGHPISHFLLLLAGTIACRKAPPEPLAEPDEPDLVTAAWSPLRHAVAAPRDVVVPKAVATQRNEVFGTGWCDDETCVLSHLQPAERVVFRVDTPTTVELRSHRLPAALPLLEGSPLIAPVEVPAGSALGRPHLDVAFSLDAAADVSLDWQALGGDRNDAGPRFVSLSLYGPRGEQNAHVMGQYEDEPGRRRHTFALAPGEYTARIVEDTEHRRIACTPFEFPGGFSPPVPDWCGLAPDDGPLRVSVAWVETVLLEDSPTEAEPMPPADLLADGLSTLALVPEPEPARRTWPVPPGDDVVLTWTPEDVDLAYSWKVSEDHWSRGACEEGACRFHAVPFSEITAVLHPSDTARQVDVDVQTLPLPEPAFTLQPGYVADTWLRHVSDGDPRGPLLDFLIEIAEPGQYRVGVAWTEGESRPYIELLHEDEGITDTLMQTLGGDPYELSVYDVERPGVWRVRLVTCPTCPEQAVQVELQAE